MTGSSLAEAAVAYARAGWPVLPLKPRNKPPLTRHGVHDATTNGDQVTAWWRSHPQAIIGLAVPRGLVVVDIDSVDAYGHLRAEGLVLPATVTAVTGHGRHHWYRTGSEIRSQVGLLHRLDLRAFGTYVVAPPSVHPSGRVYRWEVALDRDRLADAPDWLSERATRSAIGQRPTRDWVERLREPVREGRRNQALAEVAGLTFRYLPPKLAAELAFCWAQVRLVPRLSEPEVWRTIDSIAGRELRQRQEGQ